MDASTEACLTDSRHNGHKILHTNLVLTVNAIGEVASYFIAVHIVGQWYRQLKVHRILDCWDEREMKMRKIEIS
jgi:hypothetical protein